MKPKAFILVGVPASGKSTWAQRNCTSDTVLLSSDAYIEAYAKEKGKTYSEVFAEYINVAISKMMDDLEYAKANKIDIIWDQTNLTAKTRANKLRLLRGYEKIAVVFKTPEPFELERRIMSRHGKTIPYSLLNNMIDSMTIPTIAEGFDEIMYDGV